MSFELEEMHKEAVRHQAIEQYLRNNLIHDVYGGSPHASLGGSPHAGLGSPGRMLARSPVPVGGHSPVGIGAGALGTHTTMYVPPVMNMPITQVDKVRMTFQDLDYNKNGVVDIEEFKRALAECKLDLSPSTGADLFGKAKQGATGDLSESEWHRFIQQYPMLLDALYHRFRALKNAEKEAEAAKAAQERLDERAAALRTEAANAAKSLEEQEQKARDEEGKMAEQQEKAKASEEAHRNAVELVGVAFRERQDTEKKVAAEWEATRAQRIAAAEAARDADVAERRLAAAEERERWALQALENAKKEKEQAQADLDAARSRQVDVKTGEDPEALLSEADRKVGDAQRKEYELGVAAADEAAKADRLRWSRDEQERLRAGNEARLKRANEALEDAEKACLDNSTRLAEAENVKANGVTVDEKENQLVEQEIRLKEQRECLEEKENTLHRECQEYHNRVSPVRERPGVSAAGSPYTPTKVY